MIASGRLLHSSYETCPHPTRSEAPPSESWHSSRGLLLLVLVLVLLVLDGSSRHPSGLQLLERVRVENVDSDSEEEKAAVGGR